MSYRTPSSMVSSPLLVDESMEYELSSSSSLSATSLRREDSDGSSSAPHSANMSMTNSPLLSPSSSSIELNLLAVQRCPLCACRTRPSFSHCLRCGLTTDPLDQSDPTAMNEAVAAFKFTLYAQMSPLIEDLAKIVVDYLLWYRDVSDFHVSDRVDVADHRGCKPKSDEVTWLSATIRQVDSSGSRVLVSYDGYSRKWDQWIDIHSERLAPFGTKTRPAPQH